MPPAPASGPWATTTGTPWDWPQRPGWRPGVRSMAPLLRLAPTAAAPGHRRRACGRPARRGRTLVLRQMLMQQPACSLRLLRPWPAAGTHHQFCPAGRRWDAPSRARWSVRWVGACRGVVQCGGWGWGGAAAPAAGSRQPLHPGSGCLSAPTASASSTRLVSRRCMRLTMNMHACPWKRQQPGPENSPNSTATHSKGR